MLSKTYLHLNVLQFCAFKSSADFCLRLEVTCYLLITLAAQYTLHMARLWPNLKDGNTIRHIRPHAGGMQFL